MPTKILKTDKAFTMIELIVVMAIISISYAAVRISTGSMPEKNLNAACLELQADLRYAQRMAITEGRKYEVLFDIPDNCYYILYYTNDTGISNELKKKGFDGDLTLVHTTAVNGSVTYTSRGTTGDACTITLQNSNYIAKLTVNVGSGRIREKSFTKISP